MRKTDSRGDICAAQISRSVCARESDMKKPRKSAKPTQVSHGWDHPLDAETPAEYRAATFRKLRDSEAWDRKTDREAGRHSRRTQP